MNTIIAQKQRYLPHTSETKYHAVKTYRSGCSIRFVCRKYKISKASLMRWNKKFDGDKASLIDKSHRPHSKHPKAHTDDEIRHIKNYIRRNPNISMIELYAKLKKNKSYKRHPCSLFRLLRKMGFFKNEKKKEKKYVPKKYHTPDNIGEKWQLDVKYVPQKCYVGDMPDKFYQYTMIDEASRERFYSNLTFYSYDDLIIQMKRYLYKSNRLPMQVLGCLSPIEIWYNGWRINSNHYTKFLLFSLYKMSHIIYKHTHILKHIHINAGEISFLLLYFS